MYWFKNVVGNNFVSSKYEFSITSCIDIQIGCFLLAMFSISTFIVYWYSKLFFSSLIVTNKLYLTKFRGDDTKTYQIFWVPIGNAKITRKVQFHPAATLIEYHQKISNSCCLSSLASAFNFIIDNRDIPALVNHIEEKLTLQTENCKNIIHFANDITKNRVKVKVEQNLRYNLTIWKNNDTFYILT